MGTVYTADMRRSVICRECYDEIKGYFIPEIKNEFRNTEADNGRY
jgi:hypothetical protein